MRQITISANDGGQRLDKFLQKFMPALPQALMYRYLREKRVRINGEHCKSGERRLCRGDVLTLYIRDEFFRAPSAADAFAHKKARVCVIYEDENLLIAEKPAGQLCHAGDGDGAENADTLIDHIKAYLHERGEYDPAAEQSFVPALCNRIDRNTAGLVLAAKNAEALRQMNLVIREKEGLEKFYLCAVHGAAAPCCGTLRDYLRKDAQQKRVFLSKMPQKGAKLALTQYCTLAKNETLSLLLVRLITGRTHQIRAQFANAGMPLLGDGKYAVNKADRALGYKSQALYAACLRFSLPPEHFFGYLSGRLFFAPHAHIWFLREFSDFPSNEADFLKNVKKALDFPKDL